MVIAQSRRVFLGVRYVCRVCISVVYACNGCVFVYAYLLSDTVCIYNVFLIIYVL